MENMIKQGFTCYLTIDKDNAVQARYLKRVVLLDKLGYEREVIEKFPTIVDYLKEGYMLQLFSGKITSMMVGMIGKRGSEGEYSKLDSFDVTEISTHTDLVGTLIELDFALANNEVVDFS